MRLPTEVLDQHLRPILEGLLLWSEDSKNKFKLKVCFGSSGLEGKSTPAQLSACGCVCRWVHTWWHLNLPNNGCHEMHI